MNKREERAHIYSMMRDITAERRELTKMYNDLMSRLDSLEYSEEEELTIEDHVNMYNRIQNENFSKIVKEEKNSEEEDTVIPKYEIELAKDREAVKNKNRNVLSLDKATGMIAHALKEHGVPMKVSDLYEAVNNMSEVPISKSNFRNNILPRSMRLNKNIDNIRRGFYQYLHK